MPVNKRELAAFIDYEGGVSSAIDAGQDPEEIKSKKVRKLWNTCVETYIPFRDAANALELELGIGAWGG